MAECPALPSVEMLIAEFDQLWSAAGSPGNRRRMDELIAMIEADEFADGIAGRDRPLAARPDVVC